MAIERSYGRIIWHNNAPVFQIVNPQSQQFIIYTEPILNLFRNLNSFVRIKRKDNNQNSESGFYQGEIYGSIDECVGKIKSYYKLSVYIGAPSKILEVSSDNELRDVIEMQEYYFPKVELTRFIECIDSMYTQNTHFSMLMMNTDVIYPGEKSLLLKNER